VAGAQYRPGIADHLADNAVQRLLIDEHVVDRWRSGPVLDVQGGGCVSLRVQVNHEHLGTVSARHAARFHRRGGLGPRRPSGWRWSLPGKLAGGAIPVRSLPARRAPPGPGLTATGPGEGPPAGATAGICARRVRPPRREGLLRRRPGPVLERDSPVGRHRVAPWTPHPVWLEAGTIGREPTGRGPVPPGVLCSKRAPPPAGFPRVLTVPLPCASSRVLTFRASVSRETAADSACLTRAGGSPGPPSRKTLPLPTLARPTDTPRRPRRVLPGPRDNCPAAGAGCLVPGPRRGQPSPAVMNFDSSLAARRENPAGSSGHPRARPAKPSARSSPGSPAPFSGWYRCAVPLPGPAEDKSRSWSWRAGLSRSRTSRPVPGLVAQSRHRYRRAVSRTTVAAGSTLPLPATRTSASARPSRLSTAFASRTSAEAFAPFIASTIPPGLSSPHRQGRQPVKGGHGTRGHHIHGQFADHLLGPGPHHRGIAQRQLGHTLFKEGRPAQRRLQQDHLAIRQHQRQHNPWQPCPDPKSTSEQVAAGNQFGHDSTIQQMPLPNPRHLIRPNNPPLNPHPARKLA